MRKAEGAWLLWLEYCRFAGSFRCLSKNAQNLRQGEEVFGVCTDLQGDDHSGLVEKWWDCCLERIVGFESFRPLGDREFGGERVLSPCVSVVSRQAGKVRQGKCWEPSREIPVDPQASVGEGRV